MPGRSGPDVAPQTVDGGPAPCQPPRVRGMCATAPGRWSRPSAAVYVCTRAGAFVRRHVRLLSAEASTSRLPPPYDDHAEPRRRRQEGRVHDRGGQQGAGGMYVDALSQRTSRKVTAAVILRGEKVGVRDGSERQHGTASSTLRFPSVGTSATFAHRRGVGGADNGVGGVGGGSRTTSARRPADESAAGRGRTNAGGRT